MELLVLNAEVISFEGEEELECGAVQWSLKLKPSQAVHNLAATLSISNERVLEYMESWLANRINEHIYVLLSEFA
jgi:hypothetical protein